MFYIKIIFMVSTTDLSWKEVISISRSTIYRHDNAQYALLSTPKKVALHGIRYWFHNQSQASTIPRRFFPPYFYSLFCLISRDKCKTAIL